MSPDTHNTAEKQHVAFKEDRWVKPFLFRYRRVLLLALFLGLATFIFAGALMFTSGYLIGRAAEMPLTVLAIHLPLVFVRVFGIGKPILQYLERLKSHDWVLRMTSSLRLKLYTALESDAVFFRRSRTTGDILGLLAEDIGHIQNLYLRTIFPTVIAWLLSFVVVIALGCFSVWFALFMLFMLVLVVVVVPLVSALANRARQTRRKAMKNELYSELTDNVLGIADWVFAGRGNDYLTRYKTTQSAMRDIDTAMNRFARWRDLILHILFGCIVVVLIMWTGGYFGGSTGATSNWIAAFVIGFFPLIDAFTPLSAAATEAVVHQNSIMRLNKLPDENTKASGNERRTPADEGTALNSEGCTPVGEKCALDKSEETSAKSTSMDIASLSSNPLTVQIEHVDFQYPETTRMVLHDISLTIAPGEKIAILGKSGSGKSTLASLIRGDLIPTQGTIALNALPSYKLGDDIARYIGIIQQKTYLFNESLLDNLRIGNQDATEAEVWEALKSVGLNEMVQRLPDGLDTVVDEAGMRFSGGERHRIALARVLLQKAPIVILDEPTVGLDPITEAALLDTILSSMEGRTLILITHHLQGISAMDRVIFIEEGSIEMDGTPAHLEKTNPHYRKLQEFDRGIE